MKTDSSSKKHPSPQASSSVTGRPNYATAPAPARPFAKTAAVSTGCYRTRSNWHYTHHSTDSHTWTPCWLYLRTNIPATHVPLIC